MAGMAVAVIFDNQFDRVERVAQFPFNCLFHRIDHVVFVPISAGPRLVRRGFGPHSVGTDDGMQSGCRRMAHLASRDPRARTQVPPLCAHPDCLEDGVHPAPRSRDRLRDYLWFCKEHAREYNAAWDYCRGLGQAQIDAIIRQDVTWGRPTWPLGMHKGPGGLGDFTVRDTSGLFDLDREPDQPPDNSPVGSERWAMRVLGLSAPLTLTGLKARYKELAKQLHPDVNGGADVQAEERFKKINLAYATLRATLSARP